MSVTNTPSQGEHAAGVTQGAAQDSIGSVVSLSDGYRLTYKTLRWLVVALAALLFTVTTATTLLTGEWPTSISAYYGGTVRDVFVGALFSIAACLVAYRGANPLEDFALNAAGFYAIFVALIPTNLLDILADLRANTAVDKVTAKEYIVFLRVSVAVVLVLCLILAWREVQISRRLGSLWTSGEWSQRFTVAFTVVLAAFLVLAAFQLYLVSADQLTMSGLQLGGLKLRVHDLAAILLIISLAAAVWSRGWPDKAPQWNSQGPLEAAGAVVQNGYRIVFILMTLGGIGVVLVAGAWLHSHHTVAILEWWEIALFVAFWLLAIKQESDGAADTVTATASA